MYNKESDFQKKISNTIKDAKLFNTKIDDYIKETNKFLHSAPPKINQGEIRIMNEIHRLNKVKREKLKQEFDYQKGKKQYEKDMHDMMEKIIKMKEQNKLL